MYQGLKLRTLSFVVLTSIIAENLSTPRRKTTKRSGTFHVCSLSLETTAWPSRWAISQWPSHAKSVANSTSALRP